MISVTATVTQHRKFLFCSSDNEIRYGEGGEVSSRMNYFSLRFPWYEFFFKREHS